MDSPPFLLPERLQAWLDGAGTLLIVLAGMLATLDSFLEFEHEMIPLVFGLLLLLLGHAHRRPIRLAYALLLLLAMRIVLQGDERYLGWEITLSDYVMIVVAFAAGFRLPVLAWKRLFALLALLLPLPGTVALVLHRLREPTEPFNAGTLSINQTAFLFGLCLTIALAFLLAALGGLRAAGGQGAAQPAALALWGGATAWNGFLVLQTQSRAGLGIPLLSLLLVGLYVGRHRLLRAIDGWIDRRLPSRHPLRLRWLLGLGALAVLALGAFLAFRRVYADPENLLSDMNRLSLLRCYFSAMLTGNNRFIYGMGFTGASQTICQNAGPLKNITHAHNIFAQLAADNGFFAMLCLLILVVLLVRCAGRLAAFPAKGATLAALGTALYCGLFLQIEGGWGKVTVLQALIGLSLASLTMEVPGASRGSSPAAPLAEA